jgi:hypothetical protein
VAPAEVEPGQPFAAGADEINDIFSEARLC